MEKRVGQYSKKEREMMLLSHETRSGLRLTGMANGHYLEYRVILLYCYSEIIGGIDQVHFRENPRCLCVFDKQDLSRSLRGFFWATAPEGQS